MSTGLFADEEDGYNIEETKYKLKVDNPEPAPAAEPMAPEGGMEDMGDMDGLDALEDAPEDDKPFDDEPFDAGVEADEDTDPEKYIQQLAGKLGQSLRQYTDDTGQPDFDLEKFAVNSVLSATHTAEMDREDQKDIINKVKGAGKDDEHVGGDEADVDVDVDVDEPTGDELDFGEEPVEESGDYGDMEPASVELARDIYHRSDFGDNTISNCCGAKFVQGDICSACGEHAAPMQDEGLHESKKIGTFVDKTKIVEKLRLMENTEPLVEPKPTTKPAVKPARPMRETDRPFLPKRKDKVKPNPKAEDGSIIADNENE